jgi:signal transduction histidine kinase/CheY-like chemotaxis protein
MITSAALGRITVGPGDDPAAVWEQVRALAAGGGLPPLAAARLALAAVELIGSPRGRVTVEVAAVSGGGGAQVQAVVLGGTDRGDGAAARLADICRPYTTASGAEGRMVVVTAGQQVTPPGAGLSWQEPLNQAAQRGGLTALLAAALIGLDDQARRLAEYHTEITQLRGELDATSQGLLALHAELSDQRDELERAHTVAERAGQAKAAFLASMSHEIRSPLNAMIGFTSLLRETALTPEQAEYADTFTAAGSHLKDLVNAILDLSKVESGQLELEDVPFDLVTCIEEAAGIVAPQAEDKRLALAALVGPDLPALVAGDPLRLRQILVNLLSNAVKFTDRGQVTVEVSAQPGAVDHERRLAFSVRDTGPGIPASALERLFDPFTQADASTARRFGGTGLGLAICRQLTERMGGRLAVASTPGHGATFTATIPLREPRPAISAGPDQPLSGVHVLLVHPYPAVAEAARQHLTGWGAAVTVAASAGGAAQRAPEWADAALALVGSTRPAALPAAIRTLTAARGGRPLPVVALTPLIWRPAPPPIPLPWTVTTAPIRRARLREAVLGALGLPDPAHGAAPAGPVATGAAEHSGPATAPHPGDRPVRGAGQIPPAHRTVLYIDDNPTLRGLAERILTKDPAITVLTAGADTGLEQAIMQRPDLILLDLQQPGARGETLIGNLRSDEGTSMVPIIVVSGDTSPATIKRLTSLGATAYLAKPFDAEHLRAVVAATASQRQPAEPAIG